MNTSSIYLAADSTVQRYDDTTNQGGWGQFLHEYITSDFKVINRAIGGRSSKTFVEEGRLDRILQDILPNDWLFVQMGHNDASKNNPDRYTEPFTTYKYYLRQYVTGARQKGASSLLITPVARFHYKNGQFINDFPDYCTAMNQVAEEEQVPLIDLMEKSLAHFKAIGEKTVYTYFMVSEGINDYTHFTKKGAREMARLVAEGMREHEIR
ncbi:rhamnogalacturonan acetylesterase [Bacillus sp. NPDC077027]|uniref:rhamnogalacturonan acetylesterase n=1 Tax=Bacillus sp. NPDC077027 TaxID=3390548 RepID=UPI003D063364